MVRPRGLSAIIALTANATNAAFTANVEVLLELEGRRAAVGVAKWLEPPADREQPRFRSLLEEHPWDPNQTVVVLSVDSLVGVPGVLLEQ